MVELAVKDVDNQEILNEFLAVKYLYDFFTNRVSENQIKEEEGIKSQIKNECLSEMIKSLSTKGSKNSVSIIQMNSIFYPKHWKTLGL